MAIDMYLTDPDGTLDIIKVGYQCYFIYVIRNRESNHFTDLGCCVKIKFSYCVTQSVRFKMRTVYALLILGK